MNKFDFKISITEENYKNYLENPKSIWPALEHLIHAKITDNLEKLYIQIDQSTHNLINTTLPSLVLSLNDKELTQKLESILNRPLGLISIEEGFKKNKLGQYSDTLNHVKLSEDYDLLLSDLKDNEELNSLMVKNLNAIFLEKFTEKVSLVQSAQIRIELHGYTKDLVSFCRLHLGFSNVADIFDLLKNKPDFTDLFNDLKENNNYLTQFVSLYEKRLLTLEDVKEDELIHILKHNPEFFNQLLKDGLDLNNFNIEDILSHAGDVNVANLLVKSTNKASISPEKALETLSPKELDLETFKYYATELYQDLLKDKSFSDKLIKNLIEKATYTDELKPLVWDKIIFLKDNFNANIRNKNMLVLFELNEDLASSDEIDKKMFCYKEKVKLNMSSYFQKLVSSRQVKRLNHIAKNYPNWLGASEAYYILKEGTTSQLLDFVMNKLKEELFKEANSYVLGYFGVSRKQDLRAIRQAYKAQFNQDIDINQKTTGGNTFINQFLNHYLDKGKYEDKINVHEILNLSKTTVIDASATTQFGNNPLFGIFGNSRLNFQYDEIKKEELVKQMINVNINHQNKEGNTVFHHLIEKFSYDNYKIKEAIDILLPLYKFDPSIKNNKGQTVIDLLSETNTIQHLIVDFEKLLLENGINQEVNAQKNRKIKI